MNHVNALNALKSFNDSTNCRLKSIKVQRLFRNVACASKEAKLMFKGDLMVFLGWCFNFGVIGEIGSSDKVGE